MKDELARRLLSEIMEWGPDELTEFGGSLQVLATLKYDEYEGYRPGERFLETLAAWLQQFEPNERVCMAEFVRDALVFVSRAELDHAIESVYPDAIRRLLLREVAHAQGKDEWRVADVAATDLFRSLQRRTLILGLSDGARLDRLRRSAPELSHEQFWLTAEVGPNAQESMRTKLAEALAEMHLTVDAKFTRVLLLDDFAGSGYTLLHPDGDGWGGKLWRAQEHLKDLEQNSVLAADAAVCVILYVVTEQALDALKARLRSSGLKWDLQFVQLLGRELTVSDPAVLSVCKRYFDPLLADSHMAKGNAEPHLGFGGLALPVIMQHNAPNNSVAVLWGDTRERPEGRESVGLFPRRLRHQPDKP